MSRPRQQTGLPGTTADTPSLTFRDRLTLYRPDLAGVLEQRGEAGYRYGQLYDHLMRHPDSAWERSTALPSELRLRLAESGTSVLRLKRTLNDEQGTSKLVFNTADDLAIESVIMRYRADATLCVSSQIGCALGCTFCATGQMGFRRNLTTAEILDQVRAAQVILAGGHRRATNVVFMGMGEPLLNLPAVLPALRLLHDPDGLAFAKRSLSVSTIGIPAGIGRLARDEPQVNLAVSLHAPDDKLRRQLMPAARRYPIHQLLEACDEHFRLTRRKLFVEYLLLGGVNDSPRHASALAALLRGRVLTVNLIPLNEICGDYQPSPPEAVAAFRRTLTERGLEVSVRNSRGWSIAAACGQLAGPHDGRQREPLLGRGSTQPGAPGHAGRPPSRARGTKRREGRD
jgi:23S rRNA (adenine2503-C2)-methyltransferase